ncbi:hypothetical protein BjapCC829_31515 [Bradyrhizobium barranii]|uniref:Uncharacterized protein n=1 Tax=Bradyrhizobium barranii TaxID=2992140 RepID=A0ABY3QHM2_9BRAD|nr:hypothetical protein [Bradyrhizobium japonicum]UFW84451.1 hypothetical protein BjapCC829_31515 [Bradyrhizobium japonicum]
MSRFPVTPWKPHEPRFILPTFEGLECRLGLSIPIWYKAIDATYLRSLVAGALKKNLWEGLKDLGPELASLLKSGVSNNLRFKLHVLSRDGNYLASREIDALYKPGASFEVDLSRLISELGLASRDYLIVAVMSHGRMDAHRSSPGSFSMTYVDQDNVAIYRTGAFARPLNEGRLKSHVGFTGINPKILATDDFVSSLMLINHSSDPDYVHAARPSSVLIRDDGEQLEGDFGEIPPLGAREMSVVDLFGSEVFDFLKPFGGKGTTVTTCTGVTLASLHLQRSNDNRQTLLGIEHSRPAHMNLMGIVQH